MKSISRLLVFMPSWVGDIVMATPALRLLHETMPDVQLSCLLRPGVASVIEGCPWIENIITGRAKTFSEVKDLAHRLHQHHFDAVLLLPNSFNSALICFTARIPRRVGYNRDHRGLLLTKRCPVQKRPGGGYAPVPAVDYYLNLVDFFLDHKSPSQHNPALQLWTTAREEAEADRIWQEAGLPQNQPDSPVILLNPGANRQDKRWPAERFGLVADQLAKEYNASIIINGSPAEQNVLLAVRDSASVPVVNLQEHGITLSSLKAVMKRVNLVITNDTGPRHMAVAMNTPVVTLFGPTDPRWTTLAFSRQVEILADPTLDAAETADDHPERCAITRITVPQVLDAARELLQPALPQTSS